MIKWGVNVSDLQKYISNTKFSFLTYNSFISENNLYGEMEKRVDKEYLFYEIEDWLSFQSGEKDLSKEDFFNFFLHDVDSNQLILLFTEEGMSIKNNCFFKFHCSDFVKFSTWYEDYFSMDFFQFSYYLLLCPQLNKIKFLDDEGGMHVYKMI